MSSAKRKRGQQKPAKGKKKGAAEQASAPVEASEQQARVLEAESEAHGEVTEATEERDSAADVETTADATSDANEALHAQPQAPDDAAERQGDGDAEGESKELETGSTESDGTQNADDGDPQPLEAAGPELTSGGEANPDDDAPVEPAGPHASVDELPRDEQRKLVESLVFVSDRAISAQQLGRMLKIRSALAKELADELIEQYQGRGIELVELSGGYQFRSAASSARVVREHIAQPPVRLTRAQLETLALVAYRQPITRPEIDEVRGVDSGSALRVLLERGLLKMLGRKDEPGRPLLYGTAPFFLDFFGMRSLKDLPTLREFTELSEENRALFKRKTGESVEQAEAALLAADEERREREEQEEQREQADQTPADERSEETSAHAAATGEDAPPVTDRDLEVEADTFASGSVQTREGRVESSAELGHADETGEPHELDEAYGTATADADGGDAPERPAMESHDAES